MPVVAPTAKRAVTITTNSVFFMKGVVRFTAVVLFYPTRVALCNTFFLVSIV